MGDVLRAAVAVHHDIAQEDVLQNLRDTGLILRRHDQAGTHAVAADIALAILQGHRLGEHVHSGLRAGIGRGAQIAAAGSHGADVDDGAALFILHHVGQSALDDIESPPQVALEDSVPHFDGDLVHPAVSQAYIRCVIHQNVQSPVLFHRVRHQSLDAGRLRDVHDMERSLAARLADLLRHSLAAFHPPAADHHFSALRRVRLRNADADTAGGAGDDCYFVF